MSSETKVYDAKFYESIIRKYKKDDSIEISGIDRTEAVTQGNNGNFLSQVRRVKAKGVRKDGDKQEDCEYDLFIKEVEPESEHVEVMKVAFKNECVAYDDIIPTLCEYSSHPIPVPQCLFSNHELIVLEDLSQMDYKYVNKNSTFTSDQVEVILKEIANLHSASLVFQQKDPEAFKQLVSKVTDFVYGEQAKKIILNNQEDSIVMALELLEENRDEKAIKSLTDLKGKTRSILTDLIQKERKYSVINHGDMWSNNIMTKGEEIKLIDLQIMRCTSVAADLSYFMFINIHPDTRREKYDEYLKVYLDELHECINKKDISLKNELTIDWLKNEMKEFETFGFVYGMWFLPLMLKESDETSQEMFVTKAKDLNTTQKERLLQLVREHAELVDQARY